MCRCSGVCGFGNYRCENRGSALAVGVQLLVAERCEFSSDYLDEASVVEAAVYHITMMAIEQLHSSHKR